MRLDKMTNRFFTGKYLFRHKGEIMQPHLKRAFTLLAIAIIGFIIIRSFVVPESFGQYGWYRGDAIKITWILRSSMPVLLHADLRIA